MHMLEPTSEQFLAAVGQSPQLPPALRLFQESQCVLEGQDAAQKIIEYLLYARKTIARVVSQVPVLVQAFPVIASLANKPPPTNWSNPLICSVGALKEAMRLLENDVDLRAQFGAVTGDAMNVVELLCNCKRIPFQGLMSAKIV